MFENRYDSHVHSRNSHDGKDEVSAICETALRRGLKGIAFTDHCDTYSAESACLKMKRILLRDIRRARGQLGGQLAISAGLELGEPHHAPEMARRLVADPEIDFVIGSLHQLRDEEDFYHVDYDRLSDAELDATMRRYYRELAELAECGHFDVVGHINYQVRYMSAEARGRLDLSAYYGELSQILRMLARNGKGIEINTSGLRRDLGDTLPSPEVVKMFKEEGGDIVTIGSDTHSADSVGTGLLTAMESLLAVGFDHFSFFEKRKPVEIPIA